MADRLGDAVEDLAVVHLQRHADAQPAEDLVDDLHQLDLAEQRARADDVDVALVEFAVAPLLRAVGTPHGLDLVAFEGEGQLALVLHDIAGEGDRQVVAQPLLADARRLAHLVVRESGGVVARVENLEEELVALVAVFAQQRREVLHRRGLERRKAVGAEHRADRIENVVAAHHLHGGEVARALGYGRFLHVRFSVFVSFVGAGAKGEPQQRAFALFLPFLFSHPPCPGRTGREPRRAGYASISFLYLTRWGCTSPPCARFHASYSE